MRQRDDADNSWDKPRGDSRSVNELLRAGLSPGQFPEGLNPDGGELLSI